MNDRYLFRGKREDNGEWVVGCLIICDNEYRIATSCLQGNDENLLDNVCAYKVIPETVGQCTGLKYNDGKLIFEGDIAYDKQGGYFYIVKWFPEYAGFYFADKNGQIAFGTEELEVFLDNLVVMGNIHDNPELLEVKE